MKKIRKKRNVLLSAGGTGGHLSPALAMAERFSKRNYRVTLISDDRCKKYIPENLPYQVLIYKSHRISKNPIKLLLFVIFTFKNIYLISRKIINSKIGLVISFGGYTSLTSNIAAIITFRNLILHEQNAVAGRINRFFAGFAKVIACSYPKTMGFKDSYKKKLVFTGLPVRENFKQNKKFNNRKFTILIVGGSQGAAFFAELMPQIISHFDENIIKNIKIIQQAKKTQIKKLAAKYKKKSLSFEISSYFYDMDKKISEADLIISRAGASSVAEIMYANKISILIPYPHAKDNHQYYNAKYLQEAGASSIYLEHNLNIENLASDIKEIIINPEVKNDAEKALSKLTKKSLKTSFLELVENL